MKHHTDHASSRMCIRQVGWVVLWLVMGLMSTAASKAQIAHDGSLAMPCPLTGPNFVIPAACGRTVGSNLFHSFSQFNIQTGESATFTDLGSINNVLVRVTGDQASTINGTLTTELGSTANFYLMNPNGVMFGPDASVDVGGALVVTTADAIHLTDGQTYVAESGPDDATLTTAEPAAFGFLDQNPASVTIDAGTNRVKVDTGKALSVISGPITIQNSVIRANDGRINLVAVGSPGTIHMNAAAIDGDPDQDVQLTGFDALDDITLQGQTTRSQVQVKTGDIVVRGRDLQLLDESNLFADVGFAVSDDGGLVDINLTGEARLITGGIQADTSGNGRAADVELDADSILITRNGFIQTNALFDAGDAGRIDLNAQQIIFDSEDVAEFTGLSTRAFANSTGDPGQIRLQASQSLQLLNGGGISVTSENSGSTGSIDIDDTGAITLAGPRSLISSTTTGTGPGGNITIDADSLQIDGSTIDDPSALPGITADTRSAAPSATGGTIDLQFNTLTLINGGGISASTFEAADAGNINIQTTGPIQLRGAMSSIAAGAFVNPDTNQTPSGDGGQIIITTTSRLDVLNQASFASITQGSGQAGTVTIQAASVLLDGTATPEGFTGITSRTDPDIVARGGDIDINAVSTIDLVGAAITAEASGDGANIILNARDRIQLTDARIIGRTDGDGGRITIDPVFVILDNSTINGLAGGEPVIVTIVSDFFFTSNSQILTNTPINFPQTDVTGSLLLLSENVVDPATRLAERCAVLLGPGASTFIQSGHGGLATEPGAWLPALLPSYNNRASNNLMLQSEK